jgi:hypothetical protein
MEQTRIMLQPDEALMIVRGLGTLQNRLGHHASWTERKRLPHLEQLLADSSNEEEAAMLHSKYERAQRHLNKLIADGKRCNELKERIKQTVGITGERMISEL